MSRLLLDGGASWPSPRGVGDLEWTLRYGEPTQADLMAAARIVATYLHILTHPAGTEAIVRQVRQARRLVRGRPA